MSKIAFFRLVFFHLISLMVANTSTTGIYDDPKLFVVTKSGPVQGFWQTPFFNDSSKYGAWLGIPYAQKPTKNLRFKVNF